MNATTTEERGSSTPSAARASELLIDQYLPRYDVAVVHAKVFRATPEACYRAARGLDLLRDPIIRTLLDLRALPQRLADRLAGRRDVAAVAAAPRTFRLDDMVRPPINWTLLGEEPGVEIVLGWIGRPWQPTGMVSGPAVAPTAFVSFDQPGFAKIALSLRVQPYGTTGTILTMETRVAVTDPASLRRFRRYWALIGPFSHLARWIALRRLAADLRRPALEGQGASRASPAREVATGVYWLPIRGSNVYFVRSGSSWVLIDAAWANCVRSIQQAAEALFGSNARPAAILLTHDHPDHAGSAAELAQLWGVPVYVHPDELPLAVADDLAPFERYASPLDRWIVLPLLRALGPRRAQSMLSQASLKDVARAFDPGSAVPGLPDWECVPSPGHTPGHVVFFRESDRVLITGDALLTLDLSSFEGLLWWALGRGAPRLFGAPWYSTWNGRAAEESVARLARLEPRVLASGHGAPMAGDGVARELHALAQQLTGPPAAGRGRAPGAPASRGR